MEMRRAGKINIPPVRPFLIALRRTCSAKLSSIVHFDTRTILLVSYRSDSFALWRNRLMRTSYNLTNETSLE